MHCKTCSTLAMKRPNVIGIFREQDGDLPTCFRSTSGKLFHVFSSDVGNVHMELLVSAAWYVGLCGGTPSSSVFTRKTKAVDNGRHSPRAGCFAGGERLSGLAARKCPTVKMAKEDTNGPVTTRLSHKS